MRNRLALLALAVLSGLVFAACDGPPDGEQRERQKQKENIEGLIAGQPAEGMEYSPTREGMNKWADTWEEPGKVAYVYLFAANGEKVGYFVFEGLPVSYCASLTPTQKFYEDTYSDADPLGPAPAMDGAYYSGSACTQMYGFDAVTGQYYEWTAGGAFNFMLSDQPMNLNMQPIGDATVEEVRER